MRLFLFLFLLNLVSASVCFAALKEPPRNTDPKARYVFYLHGRIIEEQGVRPKHPKYGYYEYEQILQTLESRGFTAISEARPKGTDMQQYAGRVIRQIQSLLDSGVPPSRVCVIGASKGGGIAMLVSAGMKNRNLRYVLMGSCNAGIDENHHPDLFGQILSIYEESDDIGRSCKDVFAHSTGLAKTDEIRLHLGIAHGFLYRPFKEWVDPALHWCADGS